MEAWTIQMAKWRLLKDTDIEFIDTTVKSGDKVFAPSWDIVSDVKSGKITEEQYSVVYRDMIRQSYRQNQSEWIKLIHKPKVAIACYCPAGCFCHRHILIEALTIICKNNGVPFIYKGEIVDGNSI